MKTSKRIELYQEAYTYFAKQLNPQTWQSWPRGLCGFFAKQGCNVFDPHIMGMVKELKLLRDYKFKKRVMPYWWTQTRPEAYQVRKRAAFAMLDLAQNPPSNLVLIWFWLQGRNYYFEHFKKYNL